MTDQTKATIAAIPAMRERCKKATAGPWKWIDDGSGANWMMELHQVARDDCVCLETYPILEVKHSGSTAAIEQVRAYIAASEDDEYGKADLAFIANARTDLPALLAAVEDLAAENAKLRGVLRECHAMFGPGSTIHLITAPYAQEPTE